MLPNFSGHFSRVVVSDFQSLRSDIVFRSLLARQSPAAKIPFQSRIRQADRKSARGEFGASRWPLTLARAHETENAGLRREANHGAVRRVVDSVDDPIRRDAQPEWNRHLPTTVD
jgi:hypothetical protein